MIHFVRGVPRLLSPPSEALTTASFRRNHTRLLVKLPHVRLQAVTCPIGIFVVGVDIRPILAEMLLEDGLGDAAI